MLPSILKKCRSRKRDAEIPWDMTEDHTVGKNALGGWRLFHYLRGGGLSAFGTTSRRALQVRRQNRFLAFAGVFFAVWLVLMFI